MPLNFVVIHSFIQSFVRSLSLSCHNKSMHVHIFRCAAAPELFSNAANGSECEYECERLGYQTSLLSKRKPKKLCRMKKYNLIYSYGWDEYDIFFGKKTHFGHVTTVTAFLIISNPLVCVCMYLQFNVWLNACLPSPYPSIHPFVWLWYCRKCAILIYGCHDAKPCTAYTHMLDNIRSFAFVMRITHSSSVSVSFSIVSFSMRETILFFRCRSWW